MSSMPNRVSRIESPKYLKNEFLKLSCVYICSLSFPFATFFTFPYSFFSFIHHLPSLALFSLGKFLCQRPKCCYVSKFLEQENPQDQRALHKYHVSGNMDYSIEFSIIWAEESRIIHFLKFSELEILNKFVLSNSWTDHILRNDLKIQKSCLF